MQDRQFGEGIGEEDLPAHPAPAGHRGEPDRHLGVLLDEEVLPAFATLHRDDLLLAGLEAAQEHVDGAQALGQACFETSPVRGSDDAGDPIRRMSLVALLYAERVLLLEQETVRAAQLLFPPLWARASQLVEDRLVEGA